VRGTALLVAAVIALGIAATVDALRSAGDQSRERVRSAATTSPVAELRRADVTGVLYFTVRSGNACRLRALALPSLQDAASFELSSCRFDLSVEGNVVAGPPCPGHTFEIRSVDELSSDFKGCAPAWKTTGELTFVRDGDVLTQDGNVVVENVPSLIGPRFPEGSRISVREMAWLTDTRLVVVVRGTGVHADLRDVVVLLEEGRRLHGGQLNASRIDVSQRSQQIFVAYPGGGLIVYDRRGVAVSTESRFPFPDISAAMDSPDGRFVALARPGNVCIYRETKPPPRERFPVACLPFDAVDLAWR
jgi:hypothetical protein